MANEKRRLERLNRKRGFTYALYDSGFDCANSVAEKLRRRAEDICDTQGMTLPTEQILFLYDRTPYKGGPMSGVIQLSGMAKELFYQATGCVFPVAVRLKKQATDQLGEAQLSNELYHCLRHVSLNEKTKELELVRHHGVEQWEEQIAFADGGYGYAEDAPNLFDERIYPAGINIEGEEVTTHDGEEKDSGAQTAPDVA